MAQDITVKIGKHLFNYRVAAIIRRGDALLVCRSNPDDFCFLPGGRVQNGEAALDAILRELREELQTAANVERAVFFVENFYSLYGRQVHELCLYYEVTLPEVALSEPSLIPVNDGEDEFLWVNAAEIGAANLKPDFLRDRLETLPQTLEHVVLYEN